MTRYLLDTTALIDFSKGYEPAVSRILDMLEAGAEVGVCDVSVAEFFTGLPSEAQPFWEEFITSLAYFVTTRQTAIQAGKYRREFSGMGLTLSVPDALIAAVARERGTVLVTHNTKHYPMTDIELLALERGPRN